jgi:antitoxin HicB
MIKDIDYYLSLPYTLELQNSGEEGWYVSVRELDGCTSSGDTGAEALENIRESMYLWLKVALEDGLPIPEPRPKEAYSGKFIVRMPRSLHRELAERAEEEGTSLNQFVATALALYLGQAQMRATPAEAPGGGRQSW